MAPQLDLFYIATPLFGAVTAFTLIALKLSLKRSIEINPNQLNKLRQEKNENPQSEEQTSIFENKPALKIFSFFIKTQSFLEPCLTRRSKNKLPLFMILSTLGLLSFFFPHLYYLCLIGAPLAIAFVFLESCFEINKIEDPLGNQQENFNIILEQVKEETQQEQKKQYIYIVYALIACGLSLALCGLTFKNYFNSVLSPFLVTFVINAALDLFIVRPALFLLVSFPLTLNLRLQIHITQENLRNKIQNISDKIDVKECAIVTLSPKKKQTNSPTKIPKAQRLNKENMEEDILNVAMDIVKKVKKQKKILPGLMTPLSRRNRVKDREAGLEEYSLNHLFEQERSLDDRFNQTPIAHFNFENQEESAHQSGVKTRRKSSELMIIQFKNKIEEQEKNEEIIGEDDVNDDYRKRIGTFLHSNLDGAESDVKEQNQNELKIVKISDSKILEEEAQLEEEEEENNRVSRKNNVKENFMSHKVQLLCINEQQQDERQIQEIDINSPDKRRRKIEENQDQTYIKKKYKPRHNNSNAKRRVIQFTSGQPYLEYLPKMLSKEMNQHTKRSQPIAFKSDVNLIQEKPRKSLKRVKTKKEPKVPYESNNENQCPEAIYIEDL